VPPTAEARDYHILHHHREINFYKILRNEESCRYSPVILLVFLFRRYRSLEAEARIWGGVTASLASDFDIAPASTNDVGRVKQFDEA
jgi:hypothetical protein